MEIYETERIDIRMSYDPLLERVSGEVFSKIEGPEEVCVGVVFEHNHDIFLALSDVYDYEDKDYIEKDFSTLYPELREYSFFWHERSEHEKLVTKENNCT